MMDVGLKEMIVRGGAWGTAASCMLLLLALLLAGCTGPGIPGGPVPESFPLRSPFRETALPEREAWARHLLAAGAPAEALLLYGEGSPVAAPGRDAVLSALQEAMLHRAAGEYALSSERLEWAEAAVDELRARSLHESAASLLLNDRMRSYLPSPGEMVLLPWIRMLNHLEEDDLEGAAVEARRLASALAGGATPEDGCDFAAFQHLAGLVFEAAGESNDALVALRGAGERHHACRPGGSFPEGLATDLHRSAIRLGLTELADSIVASMPGWMGAEERCEGCGEVIVILESGFIDHLRESSLQLPIFPREIERLRSGDAERIAAAAGRIAGRFLAERADQERWGAGRYDPAPFRALPLLTDAHILRLSWPVIAEGRDEAPAPVRIRAGEELVLPFAAADLSARRRADLEAAQTATLTRLVTRSLGKFLLAREIEDRLGFVAGRVANLAGNESERADTRSWTLLPDRVVLARVRLPAGSHALAIESGTAGIGVPGRIELGEVEVEPGRVRFLTRSYWPEAGAELTSRSTE